MAMLADFCLPSLGRQQLGQQKVGPSLNLTSDRFPGPEQESRAMESAYTLSKASQEWPLLLAWTKGERSVTFRELCRGVRNLKAPDPKVGEPARVNKHNLSPQSIRLPQMSHSSCHDTELL